MKPRPNLALGLTLTTAVLALLGTLLLGLTKALAGEVPDAAVPIDPEVWKWGVLAAALSTAASAIAAGYAVAKVGTAAVAAVTEKPEVFGRMLVLVGLAEGIAVYGLIVSVLILNRVL